ncbi:hypothetical protein OAA27_00640 [bacterium]|nr:hypothetical protein [bacterium]
MSAGQLPAGPKQNSLGLGRNLLVRASMNRASMAIKIDLEGLENTAKADEILGSLSENWFLGSSGLSL